MHMYANTERECEHINFFIIATIHTLKYFCKLKVTIELAVMLKYALVPRV